ncbi:MAG: hypothetical protein ACRD2N_22730 [Vicinamibacterales bacterium]
MQPIRWLTAIVWVAFLATPRQASGIVNGLPLGPVESAALLVVGWLLLQRARLSGAPFVAAALTVSLVASFVAPDVGGFTARYFASGAATGAFERSTDYPDRDFTRIDRTLEFEPGRAEFPLAFFNDISRFNFYLPHEPNRELMTFSAVWDGFWLVQTDATPRQLYLDARGATSELVLDGVQVLAVATLDAEHSTVITPSRGWHTLQVRFTSPYASPRRLSVGESDKDRHTPFAAPSVSTTRLRPWQVTAAPIVRSAMTAIDVGVLAWLTVLLLLGVRDTIRDLARQRPVWTPSDQPLALLALVAAVEAVVFATPWSWRMMTLVGGDDTLTYEYYARQIQLDSFLLAKDGGEPFFYQVLYPYVLAGMHAVFGESMFGPMLIQRLLLSLVVWMVVTIAVRIRGDEVWWTALACGVAYAFGLLAPISAKLLNESLFVPLLVAWTAVMMSVTGAPTLPRIAGAGLLAGVTALTRSTIILAWPLVIPLCWFSWKAIPRRSLLVLTLLVCSCSVISLIAIRNWIVVHQLILMPGELPVTLYGGNEPPPGVTIDEEAHRALYDRFGLHPFTRQVVEYALTAPALFFRNLFNKALFALGYFDFYAPGWGYSVGLLTLSIASVVGVALAIRAPAGPLWLVLLPALVALTQYVAVVVVYPKGMRLILPFHALMVPYAAVTANAIWRRLARRA